MSMERIIQMIYTEIGIDANSIGQSAFDSAISKRMEEIGNNELDRYFQILQDSNKELTSLIEEVIVPETWFFRDNSAFDALVKHANKNRQRYNKTPFRIMSIPSSSGEEAYSAAMALREAGYPAEHIKIDAIDISQKNVTYASNGIYRPNSFRNNMPGFMQEKYFKEVDGSFHIDDALKRTINFMKGNLFDINTLATPNYYDVIFCKNLFIYFDSENKQLSFNKIQTALMNKGLLLIGHSESNIIPNEYFEPCKIPKSFGFIKTNTKRTRKPGKIKITAKRPVINNALPEKPRIMKTATPLKPAANKPAGISKIVNISDAIKLANDGQLDKALDICNKIDTDKQDADYFSLAATIQGARKEHGKAEALYRKALFLDPNHIESLTHLSLLLDQKGESKKAQHIRQRIDKVVRK